MSSMSAPVSPRTSGFENGNGQQNSNNIMYDDACDAYASIRRTRTMDQNLPQAPPTAITADRTKEIRRSASFTSSQSTLAGSESDSLESFKKRQEAKIVFNTIDYQVQQERVRKLIEHDRILSETLSDMGL